MVLKQLLPRRMKKRTFWYDFELLASIHIITDIHFFLAESFNLVYSVYNIICRNFSFILWIIVTFICVYFFVLCTDFIKIVNKDCAFFLSLFSIFFLLSVSIVFQRLKNLLQLSNWHYTKLSCKYLRNFVEGISNFNFIVSYGILRFIFLYFFVLN